MIEDEATIADAIAVRLGSAGHEVHIESDGARGVVLCDRVRPDLVVLDLLLPGLPGLDLSRLEAGTMALHVEDLDLRQLLEESAAETKLHWPDVDVEVDAGAPVPWRGDGVRLKQVVDNLVHNAARHAPVGTPVRLEARAAPSAVTLTVADQGAGIPPDERAHVFERFYRADRGRSSELGGAGLGLAIAQWIVGLHGGQVRIEDNDPRGCRMVVELPAGGADV